MSDFINDHFIVIPVGMPKAPVTAQQLVDVVTPEPRPIWRIAQDIDAEWVDKNSKPAVWFGAVPYLAAMRDLDKVTDMYMAEPARDIVARFIGNAAQWKGERASEIKNELRRLIGQKEVPSRSKKGAA